MDISVEDGTIPEKLAQVAAKKNLQAEIYESQTLGDLKAALKRGDTVILDIQAWADGSPLPWRDTWEDGHYVVLAGMDKNNIFVMDPSVHSGYGYIPKHEFVDRWHDYDQSGVSIRHHYHLALFIHGSKPVSRFPASAIKIN